MNLDFCLISVISTKMLFLDELPKFVGLENLCLVSYVSYARAIFRHIFQNALRVVNFFLFIWAFATKSFERK